jgi:hypothetical protein
VAFTVNAKDPAAAGVPEKTPPGASAIPPGAIPDAMVNAYEPAPPLAVNVCEYGMPRNPPGRLLAMVMVGHVEAVRVTDGDPPFALETVSVALFGPRDVECTDTATLAVSSDASTPALGASTLNSAAFGPVIANGGVRATVDDAAFVIAMVVDAEPPRGISPKSNAVGLSVMPAAPDPFSATVRVPFELVIVSVAVLGPLLDGWNVSVAVVDAPAARLVAPGADTENTPASVPLMVKGSVSVTVTGDGTWLLLVIVSAAVPLAPAATLPKLTLAGKALTAGVGALARFCGSLGARTWKSVALLLLSIWLPSTPPSLRS